MNAKSPLFFGSMVVVLLLVAGSIWLQLPMWVTPMLVAALAAGFGIFTYLRAVQRPLSLEPQPDPDDLKPITAACAAAGRPDLEPAVVRQHEGVHLRVREGRLYISSSLLSLLDERELNALVLVTAGPVASRLKAHQHSYLVVWFALLAFLVIVIPWFPYAIPFISLVAIGGILAGKSLAVQRWMTRREFNLLAAQRVDLAALATGRAKMYGELFRTAQLPPASAHLMRESLETVAGEFQVDRQELVEAFKAPLADYALRWPEKQPLSPNDKLLRGLGIWLAIVAVIMLLDLVTK